MFNNNNPYQYPSNPFNAGGYVQNQQVPVMKSTLTAEDRAVLQQQNTNVGGFFRAPTKAEEAQAKCNHKDDKGMFTLQDLGNGRYRCTVCGEEFALVDPDDMADIADVCQKSLDIFNSIKTYYGQDNPEVIKIYYAMNILKQMPQMFKSAADYFKAAIPQNQNAYPSNWGSPSSMYNAMTMGAGLPGFAPEEFNNPYQGYYGQQPAPMMQNYGPNPYYQNQPAPAPQGNYGYGVPQGINYQVPVNNQVPQGYPVPQPQQFNQPTPQYNAANNPIGTMAAQPATGAPAPAAPTATTNVNVGTGKPTVSFSA